MKRKLSILLLGVMALILPSCSYANMGPGEMGLVQDSYWMIPTKPELTHCIPSESQSNEITNNVFKYPTRAVTWDATGDPGSERGPYVVVSNVKAVAEMNIPVVVTTDLTTDCESLKQFHRDVGTRYPGLHGSDGGINNEKWIELLGFVIGVPLQDTLNAVAQKYTWQQIWNDENVRNEFRDAIAKSLPQASAQRTGRELKDAYFTNFQITVLKPTPVNADLKAAIESEQAAKQQAQSQQAGAVATAQAKEAEAKARIAQLEAETKAAEQEALKTAAEIRGYPTVRDYIEALMARQGLNPYQPTYVVPQGG